MRIRLLAIFLGAFCIAGCNKIRLGYEYADWFLIYSVEENFDLEKPHRLQFKEDVAAYFKWHRKQMLPLYSNFLLWTVKKARINIKPIDIDSGFKQFQKLAQLTMDPALDKAADFLVSLNGEEIGSWKEKQKSAIQKYRKEFKGDLEKRVDQRYSKIIDELEDWTGSLTNEQKEKIKVLNNALPWNGNYWVDTRETVVNKLSNILSHPTDKKLVRAFLNDFYLHPDKFRSKEYIAKNKEFESEIRRMIIEIYKMLTPSQRENLINQVELLALDFKKLSLKD